MYKYGRSDIVYSAMEQIPRSIERVSGFNCVCQSLLIAPNIVGRPEDVNSGMINWANATRYAC